MRAYRTTIFVLIACALVPCFSPAYAQERPNIVLVFMDNFGWGEPGFNGGGITRGAATPRIDRLADEGLRLTNFNVEVQCTPSRSALMTGRYAIRSGNATVPLGEGVYGLVQWEVTPACTANGISVEPTAASQPIRDSTSGMECRTQRMNRSTLRYRASPRAEFPKRM